MGTLYRIHERKYEDTPGQSYVMEALVIRDVASATGTIPVWAVTIVAQGTSMSTAMDRAKDGITAYTQAAGWSMDPDVPIITVDGPYLTIEDAIAHADAPFGSEADVRAEIAEVAGIHTQPLVLEKIIPLLVFRAERD